MLEFEIEPLCCASMTNISAEILARNAMADGSTDPDFRCDRILSGVKMSGPLFTSVSTYSLNFTFINYGKDGRKGAHTRKHHLACESCT
jgi:hypothetical protein